MVKEKEKAGTQVLISEESLLAMQEKEKQKREEAKEKQSLNKKKSGKLRRERQSLKVAERT